MASSSLTFADWRQQTNEGLMATAEKLLEQLEDVSDLLTEIDEKYILSESTEGADDAKTSIIQRFHSGLDSARNLVNVLKREKWRLNKREMSVELRMGELEDYKTHLKKDMSSLNQTVDALSMRVVQLENQLVEAQEVQENLEAELQEHRNSLQDCNDRNMQLYTENEDLKKAVELLGRSSLAREKDSLLHELQVLQAENSKLKDMLRDAEATPLRRHPAPSPATDKDDNLATLTREFLQELASLDTKERQNVGSSGTSNTLSGTSNTLSGTSNTLSGTSNTLSGTSNTLSGTSNTLSGTSNTLSGTSNTLSGTSNTLSGTSNTLSKVGSAGAVTITSTADV